MIKIIDKNYRVTNIWFNFLTIYIYISLTTSTSLIYKISRCYANNPHTLTTRPWFFNSLILQHQHYSTTIWEGISRSSDDPVLSIIWRIGVGQPCEAVRCYLRIAWAISSKERENRSRFSYGVKRLTLCAFQLVRLHYVTGCCYLAGFEDQRQLITSHPNAWLVGHLV